MIASYAHKQFNVSDKQIKTFQSFSFDAKLITEKQDSTGRKPLTTIKGEDLSSFKLSVPLSVDYGLSPLAEFEDWHAILAKATPYILILGTKQFGREKYLLNSLSMSDTIFSEKGVMLSCTLELSFEEFVGQGAAKENSSGSGSAGGGVSPGIKSMATDNYNIGGYTAAEKAALKR